jgi:hypothetical protein
VAVAALLHPQVAHAQGFAAKALRPEQVGAALKHRHDIVITDALQGSSSMWMQGLVKFKLAGSFDRAPMAKTLRSKQVGAFFKH